MGFLDDVENHDDALVGVELETHEGFVAQGDEIEIRSEDQRPEDGVPNRLRYGGPKRGFLPILGENSK